MLGCNNVVFEISVVIILIVPLLIVVLVVVITTWPESGEFFYCVPLNYCVTGFSGGGNPRCELVWGERF